MPGEQATAAGASGQTRRWLVVGLGNPGREYEGTWHNLGFLTVDRLGEAYGIRVGRKECQALVGVGSAGGCDVLLAKPQTYMNLSGASVARLLARYDMGLADVIVVCDDLDLPWTSVRVRPKGSSGGHKGVQSVIRELGSGDFVRIRLGIHPGREVGDGAEFVLSPIRRGQWKELDELLSRACEAVQTTITEGVGKAMAKFNRRAQGIKLEEE